MPRYRMISEVTIADDAFSMGGDNEHSFDMLCRCRGRRWRRHTSAGMPTIVFDDARFDFFSIRVESIDIFTSTSRRYRVTGRPRFRFFDIPAAITSISP